MCLVAENDSDQIKEVGTKTVEKQLDKDEMLSTLTNRHVEIRRDKPRLPHLT